MSCETAASRFSVQNPPPHSPVFQLQNVSVVGFHVYWTGIYVLGISGVPGPLAVGVPGVVHTGLVLVFEGLQGADDCPVSLGVY